MRQYFSVQCSAISESALLCLQVPTLRPLATSDLPWAAFDSHLRGALRVEKSQRLNWATQFLTVVSDGTCSPNVSVRMAWISFGALPCRKKKQWQLASRCWNSARRLTCFLSASVTRKDLQFGTLTDLSFQRHYRFRPTTSGSRSG